MDKIIQAKLLTPHDVMHLSPVGQVTGFSGESFYWQILAKPALGLGHGKVMISDSNNGCNYLSMP